MFFTDSLSSLLLVLHHLRVLCVKVLKPELTTVSIPGHGTLIGEIGVKLIDTDSKGVSYFLGVPYARPPIGQLRFSAPQPADWTGTWNATFARCVFLYAWLVCCLIG